MLDNGKQRVDAGGLLRAPMIGSTLSHYRVTEKLGQGGMGEVYRAEDTNLSRQVTIKVLPDELAYDAEGLDCFERNARPLVRPESH